MRNRNEPDSDKEYYGELTAISCTAEEDRTRQEDADETDINRILERFGVGQTPQQRQVSYGELDYTMDLYTALESTAEAKRGHAKLPNDLKKLYPTWKHFLEGLSNGRFAHDLAERTTRREEERATKREERDEARRAARRKTTEAVPAGAKAEANTPEKQPLTN